MTSLSQLAASLLYIFAIGPAGAINDIKSLRVRNETRTKEEKTGLKGKRKNNKDCIDTNSKKICVLVL